MTPTTTRLHRCLVQALRSSRPDASTRPITVAEIYQDLVPYRAVRSTLGVDLNADYEHALVRLLSGEGGHVRLEPPEAGEQLRRELESPNPNVGLYRNFAACDVWVDLNVPEDQDQDLAEEGEHRSSPRDRSAQDPGRAAAGEPSPGHGSSQGEHAPAADARNAGGSHGPHVAGAGRAGAGRGLPGASAGSEAHGSGSGPDSHGAALAPDSHGTDPAVGPVSGDSTCGFCDGRLPEGRTIRYCPFCGADQSCRPCPGCGEVLEVAWRYCVACGTSISASESAGGA